MRCGSGSITDGQVESSHCSSKTWRRHLYCASLLLDACLASPSVKPLRHAFGVFLTYVSEGSDTTLSQIQVPPSSSRSQRCNMSSRLSFDHLDTLNAFFLCTYVDLAWFLSAGSLCKDSENDSSRCQNLDCVIIVALWSFFQLWDLCKLLFML